MPKLPPLRVRARCISLAFLVAATGSLASRDALAVACTTSVDCGQTPQTPVCDPQTHQCVSCLLDYQAVLPPPLSCPAATAPACNHSGFLLGQCTECSASNATRCTSTDKPVCNAPKGACGCVSDGDCGAKSGRICDAAQGTAGACVPGCRVVGGNDSCPLGQSCSAQDGGVGTCVTTTCTGDQNCTAPAPKCDLQTVPGHCVQCLADKDCTGGLVCDTTNGPKRGQCVECTPTKTSNCTPNKGITCLPSDTCGCQADPDCGSKTSGRVCGPTRTCEDGCRGVGGNGCPTDKTCTSKDDTIGQCVTSADGSSGGDGGGADGGSGGDGGSSGSSGGADGGSGGDGLNDQSLLEGGGCSCRTGTNGEHGALVAALLAAASVLGARRRRRR